VLLIRPASKNSNLSLQTTNLNQLHHMVKTNYNNAGIHYELLRCSGNLALYAGKHNKTGRHICWELLMYRYVHDTQLPNGDIVPARLRAPSSCEWGKQGWTFTDFPRAEAMMDLLAERIAA
jgi:hypothetical protein